MTAVVFDLGAVLFEWQPLRLLRQCVPDLAPDDAQAQALAARLFESFTPDSDWARFDLGRLDEDELAQRIGARLGLPPATIRRVIDAIPAHLQPQADTVALLRALKARGQRLYFLSNMPRPYADHLERANAFMADFDDGLFSGRVGLMKPGAAIFRLAEQRFGLQPAQTVFIDDHQGNVDAARQRGWQALHFTGAAAAAQALRAGAWL
jgi:putative hydrolase of the HAD superfamily